MTALVVGLLLFLGVHSVRVVADGWRSAQIARAGARRWKGVYSLLSALGLVLVIWGYAAARQDPLPLWHPPGEWARVLAAALMLVSFVLLAAANVPRNAIRARLHHPMMLGVKAWAVAHLLVNHTAADLLLFGAFLAWAVAAFVAAKRRDRAAPPPPMASSAAGTAAAVGAGVVVWVLFLAGAHAWLFGAAPLG